MMRQFSGSRVLLTGASSGIGAALVRELAKEGVDMLITARREDRLNSIVDQIRHDFSDYAPQNGTKKILFVPGDITSDAVRRQIIRTAAEQLGGIDFLINNAGAGATSFFETTTPQTMRYLMDLNYFSLFELTQLALPFLKESAASEERKALGIRPIIVNLGSIVGLRGVPHYSAYGAAKFAVTGLSEAMRAELFHQGIDVLLVCPGTTRTEFFDVLRQSNSTPTMPAHHAVSPEYVAVRIIRAMKSGRHKIIPYFPAVLLNYLNRFAPGFTDWIMARYV